MRGLILLAHGARDPNWSGPFEEVLRRVRDACPGREVRNAYLEFMAPDLVQAGAELAAAGCHAVDVLPAFLGAGGHVRKDVPALMERLRAAHPDVHWTLHPAIGESPLLLDAMARIAVGLHDTPALSGDLRP